MKTPARRGRPPSYDRDEVLTRAANLFRRQGYEATSLDDLGAAMGMNRPSLYGAFGDKRALYRAVLERQRAAGAAAMAALLSPELPLRDGLRAVYAAALDAYFAAGEEAEGCLPIGTGVAGAVTDRELRAVVRESLAGQDRAFEARFREAVARGELPPDADPVTRGMLAAAVLQSLSIRSRTGEGRPSLERLAAAAVDSLCAESCAGARETAGRG